MERRNCVFVIAEMLELIPVDKIDIIKDLKWNLDDASYKAPEETIQWERTMQTLQKHIPKPEEEWELKILSIFTTKPVDVLKKQIKDLK